MIETFRLVFQSGNFYNQESGFMDLFNTFLGTLIGSGVTVWALYRTFRQDKKNEEGKRKQFQQEKVKYFQSLVSMILTNLKTQIDYYKNFAEKLKADPFNLPLLEQATLNELEQIVHRLNQEDYYHSYLGEFGSKTEIINEYRNIISLLNYFDGNVNMFKESLQKSFEFDHERKIKLKNIVEKSMDETAGFIVNNEVVQSYHEFWNFINETLYNFHNKNPKPQNADLSYFHNNFIEVMKVGLLPFSTTVPVAHYLIIQMKNATFIYNDIKLQNLNVADDFESLHNQMIVFYKKLEKTSKRLVDYNT